MKKYITYTPQRWIQFASKIVGTIIGTIILFVAQLQTAFAQPPDDGGGGDLGDIEQTILDAAGTLQGFGRPLGVVSFTIIFLAFVASPAFRGWAQENRALIGTVLVGLVALSFAEDIVDLFFIGG